MLEKNHSTQITELLARLPCAIHLPPKWQDYFSREGLLPTMENESRRQARKHFRHEAVLEIRPTLPAIARRQWVHKAYTLDMSLSGISFLNAEQLYPGEVCRLWLPDRTIHLSVVRCRREDVRCYVVGGTFV